MNQSAHNMTDTAGIAALAGEGASLIERLEVHSGDQLGASLNVESHNVFTVGNGYDNDIVLRCNQTETTRLRVDNKRGKRRIQLLEGAASVAGSELKIDQCVTLPDNASVNFGDVAFVVNVLSQGVVTEFEKAQTRDSTSIKNLGAIVALVVGIALLGLIVLQDTWMADANGLTPKITLQQKIDELELENLEVVENAESDLPIVQGRVAGHQQLNLLRRLRDTEHNAFTLAIQVDSDLVDAVSDVYRNHGVTADISVLGVGYIRVETQSADDIAMAAIEDALQADIPNLHKIDAVNSPPEIPKDSGHVSAFDPGKEVEAVIAGSLSYVITRDQSRYFVGAILPSGHTIKSISEGTVVMLREGEETQLEF